MALLALKQGALEEIILASPHSAWIWLYTLGKSSGRPVVSETKTEAEGPKADVARGRPGRRSPEASRELCLCGHRASAHAAYRYACQALGNRKGFCACMRFLGRSSPIGKRLRAVERARAVTESKSN